VHLPSITAAYLAVLALLYAGLSVQVRFVSADDRPLDGMMGEVIVPAPLYRQGSGSCAPATDRRRR
jgi:hypothetical protein